MYAGRERHSLAAQVFFALAERRAAGVFVSLEERGSLLDLALRHAKSQGPDGGGGGGGGNGARLPADAGGGGGETFVEALVGCCRSTPSRPRVDPELTPS